MIQGMMPIEQPNAGEYEERIYDVKGPWKSGDWTWMKFEEGDRVWCGEFRGKYRGSGIARTLGVIVILTSDGLYLLDEETKEMIDCEEQPYYVEVIETPSREILMSDGYSLAALRGKRGDCIKEMELPMRVEELRFHKCEGRRLYFTCKEDYPGEGVHELEVDDGTWRVMLKR